MTDRIVIAFSYLMFGASLAILIVLGVSKISNSPIYVNPEFKPYLTLFKEDAKRFNAPIDLYKLTTIFSNTVPTGTLAYCLPSTNTVVVSSRYWGSMNTQQRKTLLYHEWGHCALKRDHTEDMRVPYSFCPASIMHPYMDPVGRCYAELEGEYLEELFTNPNNYPKISRRD